MSFEDVRLLGNQSYLVLKSQLILLFISRMNLFQRSRKEHQLGLFFRKVLSPLSKSSSYMSILVIKSQSYCRHPFWLSENGEDIQILRYGINESHAPNNDYYHEGSNIVNGGNRVATLLMYLSTVPRGGETVFPKSEVMHPHPY